MSNKVVDATNLLEFLERLGKCYRHEGVVYLVGGSSLLLVGAKESTADIDLQFEIPNERHAEFVRCLQKLSREMELPVEQASPDEFLPLPRGFRERRRYVGRYGALDVFHFDLYSVALGKLQRGSDKDFADVISMVRNQVINLANLDAYFREVLPRLEGYSPRASSRDFERKFALFRNLLAHSDD